jgi:hypothetical protein
MTAWAALWHAYGNAGDVPALLEAAAQGDHGAWSDLWDRLCHQGTTYTASYAALPYLAGAAVHQEPAPYIPGLFLVADILASTRKPVNVDLVTVRQQLAAQVAELESLAVRCLDLHAVRQDPVLFIYLLQVVLALRDEPTWQRHLTGLANREYEILCPLCGRDLYVIVGAKDAFVSEGYTTAERSRQTTVEPADPHQPEGVVERLHRLADAHGQPQVARMIRFLFGQGSCPACAAKFPIPDAVTADR